MLEQAALRSLTKFGREKGRAMRLAMSRFEEILAATPKELDATYTAVFEECLVRLADSATITDAHSQPCSTRQTQSGK